jgi:hypothetical protein
VPQPTAVRGAGGRATHRGAAREGTATGQGPRELAAAAGHTAPHCPPCFERATAFYSFRRILIARRVQ